MRIAFRILFLLEAVFLALLLALQGVAESADLIGEGVVRVDDDRSGLDRQEGLEASRRPAPSRSGARVLRRRQALNLH